MKGKNKEIIIAHPLDKLRMLPYPPPTGPAHWFPLAIKRTQRTVFSLKNQSNGLLNTIQISDTITFKD